MEQREGRILRRGNTCSKVQIFRYITEGTFDAYSWQLLENKQKFISSFLSGASTLRSIDDLSNVVLSYAELKALAIGNVLIRERVETANKLEYAKISSRQRRRELAELKDMVSNLNRKIPKQKKLIKTTFADIQHYAKNREKVSVDERKSFGEELICALKSNSYLENSSKFDTYQGFDVVLPSGMNTEHPYVHLKSPNGGVYFLEMDYDKPLGCCLRMDILLERLNERASKQKSELSQMRKQLKDAREDISLGNEYPDLIETLERELKIIDKRLNESEAE